MATRKTARKSISSGNKRSNGRSQTRAVTRTNHTNLTLSDIQPKTFAQEQMFDSYAEGYNIAGVGSAGTGKSFVALWLALNDVIDGRKQKVIIVRSAVPTREVGHLPGELDEKIAVYEAPYKDIVNQLCECGTAYDTLKKHEKIEFISTSFVRGMTFDNAVIIVDEFQSMHEEELYSVLTRVGENTQAIVIGDTRQCDLNKRKEASCFDWFMNLAKKMPNDFEIVNFLPVDIVRSGFVKRLIIANED